jgi:Tfp pilus assembly protein PilF
VLSTFFGFLTLWTYGKFANELKIQGPESQRWHPRVWTFYLLTLLFFALGLMSKPMLVSLPFVLLLLDYWPLGRSRWWPPRSPDGREKRSTPWLRMFVEKLPFLALSALVCAVTILAQRHVGAMRSLGGLPMGARVENALVSCLRYLGKMFWPANLSIIYPLPVGHWPWWSPWAGPLMAGFSAAGVWAARRRPFVATGWFWFLGMLVPVIGLVQVGGQGMADRYTYIPLVGLFIIVSWGGAEAVREWRLPEGAVVVAVACILMACGLATRRQLGYWEDGEKLFRHATEVAPLNSQAYEMVGQYLDARGAEEEAIANYRAAVEAEPGNSRAQEILGQFLYERGQVREAVEHYRAGLEVDPNDAKGHNNLGVALAAAGLTDEAIKEYRRTIELSADNADAHNNLGNALRQQGKPAEAVTEFEEALRIRPQFVEAHINLGNSLARQGNLTGAIAQYRSAISINPGSAEAHGNLGIALSRSGRRDEAVGELVEALRLKPDFGAATKELQKLQAPRAN